MAGIAMDYIAYARRLALNGSYIKAIDLYVMALEKNPQLKSLFEPEFRAVLLKCNEVLAEEHNIEKIIANFSRAINLYPDNIFFINETGRHLFMFGFYEEAWSQFQHALTTDFGSVTAEKNLNSVKNVLIERWHFRMLNDRIRNESYRAAIHEKVMPNKTRVFDLGTGTGLLAMYAAERKPLTITACDSSPVMTTLTECVLAENRLLMSVVVINKMSTAMTASDIGKKCCLLITELFDAGLFGEHILQALDHAWENILSDDAKIIPQKAEFFIVGAHSELLNAKYQLRQVTKTFLNLHPHLHVHVATRNETYDCEDVYLYKDLKYMTEPQSVIKIDFNNLKDIKDKLYNSATGYVAKCNVLASGQVNTFIGWFNLHLTENICITTDPRDEGRANAWQQAVFFDHVPKDVKKNDTLTLDFFLRSEKLILMPEKPAEVIRISPDALQFLNDTEYLKMIKNCIGMTCVYLGQMNDISEVSIIDLNPFPLYGFLMLQRGIKSLVCYAKTHDDKEFIETVFGANHMDLSNVTILVGDVWSLESFGEEKFHVIFVNVFDLCGDLDMRFKEIAQYLKNAHLMPGGLFMPSSITLMGQIVNSKWLDVSNRVYDKNLGYTVSKYVNKYQVSQNFNLDYTHLQYTPLTNPVVIGNYDHMTPEVINVPVIKDGDANALLCWYNIELIEDFKVISTKRPYSFIDGTAFLANPPIPLVSGSIANILRCVDTDGLYKFLIDNENT
ncbi:unnamed protein product [Euphydryas editha]|uniref:Protein arginine N-methyltransferase domain-containing protein n=1 Tax=Euphydryas editha TaxID=104508 RepID=A0AAU9UKB6_EUPED|nr:unnamed protein product [Euphydryas editha]